MVKRAYRRKLIYPSRIKNIKYKDLDIDGNSIIDGDIEFNNIIPGNLILTDKEPTIIVNPTIEISISNDNSDDEPIFIGRFNSNGEPISDDISDENSIINNHNNIEENCCKEYKNTGIDKS